MFQICTEVLYEPLTLLDCLHTFCGSCLKDWFGWQATAAENSPNPPAPGTNIATCPSCRATVRDTRHNATVATLLDMFLIANPDKARPDEDKAEMHEKYKPGENVLPKLRVAERSPETRRLERLEREMLDQARVLSLRDAGVESSSTSSHQHRHRREHRSRTRDASDRSDRESSRDSRPHDVRERTRRAAREEERRRRAESSGMLQPGDDRRHRRTPSQQRSRESSRTGRAIEHQNSIRSLISSSDVDSSDMEREIEEFARQIQEEGLLDGLDLDNIDLTRNDELSRKITEAYRRRQSQRARHETSRSRSNHSHRSEAVSSTSRPATSDRSRASSRQRANSENTRVSGSTSQIDDRTRPPISSTHLEVIAGPERRRRRTSSGARSATDPIRPRPTETRPAARSQTDLTLRTRSSDVENSRPAFGESRSSSMPTNTGGSPAPPGSGLSFGERASAATQQVSMQARAPPSTPPSSDVLVASPTSEQPGRRPVTVAVSPHSPLPSLGVPTSPVGHHRARSQFYAEPAISCCRCGKPHIEYSLHYNCDRCKSDENGEWNICLDCYRTGKGCKHWFGFGYAAFQKWERTRAKSNADLKPPHMLTANRYIPPKITPGGADGRRTMTTDDPMRRLQSGMFCSRCLAWANECYWRCELCNEGDWGFCNKCVSQGYNCTHPLLPLAYVSPSRSSSPPESPRMPGLPPSASLYRGPNAINLGNFKPLTFTTPCSVCRGSIAPAQNRLHCFSCMSTVVSASSVVADAYPGDYEVCMDCYEKLEADGRISAENGYSGWRRCLNGHRMVVINFQVVGGGERRHVVQELVGGWSLHMDPYATASGPGPSLQKWSWSAGKLERLVTREVAATAPSGGAWTDQFPPAGGVGMGGRALWSWYPKGEADDELMFPKGAELAEAEDVNQEWFFGRYMGRMGLFPGLYMKASEN